jgi:hypothetical protein
MSLDGKVWQAAPLASSRIRAVGDPNGGVRDLKQASGGATAGRSEALWQVW